jgi:hypothetical protein
MDLMSKFGIKTSQTTPFEIVIQFVRSLWWKIASNIKVTVFWQNSYELKYNKNT